jgi:poly(hydroxyalkanoate) depolymerase family esterase
VKETVTTEAGSRPFELYVPSGSKNVKRPLLVAIHGCTQTASDFAALARTAKLADARDILVLHPEQLPAANPSRCWNWFGPENQKRGAGEPSIIVAMVDWVKARYDVDATRVYIMGISSGGYLTSNILSCYADVFAAGAVACGGMYKGANDVVTALHTAGHGSLVDPNTTAADAYACSGSVHPRAIPLLVFDGTEDPYVVNANGKQVVAQFLQLNDLGDDGKDNDSIAAEPATTKTAVSSAGLTYTSTSYAGGLVQHYVVKGMGHAWSGADAKLTYSEPRGPDETEIIWTFLEKYRRKK